MSEITQLLNDFGFTTTDSFKIELMALRRDLTLSDVQHWIDETRTSTSITNPLGFVRSRLQNGDKPPAAADKPRHHLQTATCQCGRVVAHSHICHDCYLCPTCCTCLLTYQNKETTMNGNATATTPNLTYALTLIVRLPEALRHRTTGLSQLINQRNSLAQQICTGRPHWRDKNAEGKTAKLYVLHSTDQPCPIHGAPDPGARLRIYVGNKPTLVADALAAIDRTVEHDRLLHQLTALHRTIDSITHRIKCCYRELDYHVPGPDEGRPPRPRQHTTELITKEI